MGKRKERSLLYGCYLLQSARNQRRTYIGFTMDPKRRLRQHNGEIKGGACKTHKWKPWRMVLCVWGFPGKVLALQFEYAWQHPSLSRHVRGKVAHLGFCKLAGHGKQCPVLGVDKNVRVLLEMLQALPYCRMPLRVHFLDEGSWAVSQKMFGSNLPNHLTLTHGSFDELQHLCKQRMTLVMPPMESSECGRCSGQLRPGDRIVQCPHCQALLHLPCAAILFTGTSRKLMPDEPAFCLRCSTSMDWLVLLRNQRLVRSPAEEDECKVQGEAENADSHEELSEAYLLSQGDSDLQLSQDSLSQACIASQDLSLPSRSPLPSPGYPDSAEVAPELENEIAAAEEAPKVCLPKSRKKPGSLERCAKSCHNACRVLSRVQRNAKAAKPLPALPPDKEQNTASTAASTAASTGSLRERLAQRTGRSAYCI
ncbi:SLX1 [Symbiodinium pilosum]|uniref:Structure-specific endonuclease subunit SLX1 homolog n=1 Tax=Symbiodinium pilosum TaxID=2952 RepID=A0A812XEL6_SYMPI|nr:SLX1 [Symbiodinium pilosum]